MRFLLYNLLFLTVVARKFREFEYYGRITCENGRTCLGKDCKVEFHVLSSGGDWEERTQDCSIRQMWPDSRYHIRCWSNYDLNYEFYLKFAGLCAADGSWSEKRIRIRHNPVPVIYTGDVDIETKKRFIENL